MNAGTILSSLVDGLLIGVVYGIAAMGLNLIWGVMRVINLAHGALISLGMFGVYLVFSSFGLNPIGALLVALLRIIMGIGIYFVGIASPWAPLHSSGNVLDQHDHHRTGQPSLTTA
jgi:branched-subunit amino acid ABC-type transport system permease component